MEPEGFVADERARQQPRLARDLEAVADREHGTALLREPGHVLHGRAEARDRARAREQLRGILVLRMAWSAFCD